MYQTRTINEIMNATVENLKSRLKEPIVFP